MIYQYSGYYDYALYIATRDLGNDTNTGRYRGKLKAVIYKNLPPNTLMTVYGAFTIPNPLPLELQNINFNTYKSIDCAKLTIGNDVNPYYTKGDVRFMRGTDFNVNSNEDVKILSGTQIEPDAALNIKAAKGVEINNVKFYAQSTSQLTTSHVIISGPVFIEKGASFRINHH